MKNLLLIILGREGTGSEARRNKAFIALILRNNRSKKGRRKKQITKKLQEKC
jgi:hypothetical protein